MMNLIRLIAGKAADEKGQGLVEYVLLVSIIAIGAVVIMGGLSTQLTAEFQTIIDSLIGT